MTQRSEQDLCTSAWLHAKIGITEDGIGRKDAIRVPSVGTSRYEVSCGGVFYGFPFRARRRMVKLWRQRQMRSALFPLVAIKGLRSAAETNPVPFTPSSFPARLSVPAKFLAAFSERRAAPITAVPLALPVFFSGKIFRQSLSSKCSDCRFGIHDNGF